ncbi:MAG: acetyl-CoA carboxylase biotin carboxylase subunit family protein [Desulfococcaceae bacterium]
MEFLYLSPEFPPNFKHFIRHLNRLGARVWALGEADFHFMPEDLRSALAYYVRADLTSLPAVEQGLAELTAAQASLGLPEGFDVVESHNELWLRVEAFINDRYGLDGIRPADLDRLKRKSVMKQVFQDQGLPVARGARIENPYHGLALAADLNYPLILKPDEGVGAGGIHKIENEAELREHLLNLTEDYVLEEFIHGRIVSYDGLTDRDGRILFENSLIYGDGVLEYVQGKDTFFYVTRHIPTELAEIGRRLVRAFDIRRKFFHFEFFRVNGEYRPIEINCRPPGGPILDMMNYSADVDLYAAYAHLIVTGDAALPSEKKYHCAYVGRRDRAYRYSHEEILARCGDRLVEHGENPPVFRGAMSDYRYIIRTPSEPELLELAGEILEWG